MSSRVPIVALLIAIVGSGCAEPQPDGAPSLAATGVRFLADGDHDSGGFARAYQPRPFVFPEDHGSHPDFRTEWWYFTGNVFGGGRRHYGFELTFFRVALAATAPESTSAWATNQFWMAHFALTDTTNGRFLTAERLTRGALGLAGASHTPFRLWVEDWQVDGRGEAAAESFSLRARSEDVEIELSLDSLKRAVAQGDRGLDAKGSEPGNASYYYSLPRLAVSGTVRVGDSEADEVEGLAWMDREWATSALSEGIVGWDWFALHLSDGRDLMYYRLRGEDGSASTESGGTLVSADGRVLRLAGSDVELDVLDHWTSPVSNVRYPVRWRLRVPAEQIDLLIVPYIPNQEVNLSVRYWEGAVRVSGSAGGHSVGGNGYLELAGY
ncbi:lipocalin-like domain-containing protein [Candidatus Rariloculus sp.]|uniref:lipocalin-like domain-containing protein n=1 Tax=Candidatus Rariloculus sp. TaxID=3101265 RepID=UPI003D0C55D5